MKESAFQLINQRLTKTEFLINKDFKAESRIELKILATTKVDKDIDNKKAKVFFNLKIFDKEKLQDYPFYIDLDIEGLFSWDDTITEVDQYLELNAPSVLISYLRSVVSQLTSFAGYPPLILPLIDFTKKVK